MALTSTLGSPGIEIREIDNSVRIDASTSTTVFVPGFAAQGPVEEVMSIGSIEDFELIYGKPTNGAERYFYYTVKALIEKGGNGCRVLTSRLPYGEGLGDDVSDAYTLLAYPAVPIVKKKHYIDGNSKDYYTVDSDCFLFEDFGETFSITSTPIIDGLSFDETKSSQNIFITGDYDTDDTISITINTTELPEIGNTKDLGEGTIVIKNTDDNTLSTDTKISTELSNGVLYVNITFNIYNSKEEKVGAGVLRLAFNGANVDSEYTLSQVTNAQLKYHEAFAIADNYSGEIFMNETETVTDENGVPKTTTVSVSDGGSKDVTYLLGAPATFQISLSQYYQIITGEFIKWSDKPYDFTSDSTKTTKFGLIEALGNSAFITINTSRSTVNENFEGYYIGITDNTFVTPSDDYVFDAVTGVKITTDTYVTNNEKSLIDTVDDDGNFATLGAQRLAFKLNSNNQGSISRVMSRDITNKDISSTEFDDTLSLGLFRLTKTTDSNDTLKLNYTLREKYNWSFSKNRLKSDINSSKPVSYFADNVMENSKNILTMINPYISEKDFTTIDGTFHGKIRVFGDKLVKNLKKYERKYINREYVPTDKN